MVHLVGDALVNCKRTSNRDECSESTPTARESVQVDLKLRLPETRAIGERSRGIGDALDHSLCPDVLLDVALQALIIRVRQSVDDVLEHQSAISGPSIEI